MKREVEILAPAGSWECLEVASRCDIYRGEPFRGKGACG